MPNRGVDHLVVVVHDLDRTIERYQAMGFTTTPPARHPFGTGNSLVQLDGNFIELLGIVSPADIPASRDGHFNFAAFSRDYEAAREGMCMLVFESQDARADRAEFLGKDLDTYAPFAFERQAKLPDGSEVTVGFSLAFVTHPQMPDAAFFCCQQHAPQYFWKPEYQRHDNGAEQIVEVMMVADRPGRFAPLLRALHGNDRVVEDDGVLRVQTARGVVSLSEPERFSTRFPGMQYELAPETPHFAGYRIRVGDINRARERLEAGGLAHVHEGDSLRIGPNEAFGLVVEMSISS